MVELFIVLGIILINVIYDVIVYMTHNDISYMICLFAYSVGIYLRYQFHESQIHVTRRQKIKELFINLSIFMSVTLGFILIKAAGWANIYTMLIYYFVVVGVIILYINRRNTQVRESRDK
ncbi:hypothetical protein [Mammaliicoccus sciuri]|uniref:hypothetical protein n=1 Tax=Mammaliicoccus sciuri TaxID=1296 RepID=UPI000BBE87C7|nr:hypothetical protein [Mammaliicoccus sciuri]MEB6195340.1 hypothetical protein [Mammaliicoccus sciuri]PCM41100.1 hypothetical protein CPU09_06870 [Mammaliicoccus sciuri]UXU78144.1 hypothetical protein MUA27_00490 [Mammaliicoccus sciuri]